MTHVERFRYLFRRTRHGISSIVGAKKIVKTTFPSSCHATGGALSGGAAFSEPIRFVPGGPMENQSVTRSPTARLGVVPVLAIAAMVSVPLGTSQAEPLRIGAVDLSLEAKVSETYDDNIYSSQDDQVDDVITTTKVEIDADWRGDADRLGLTARGWADFFADHSTEDRQQYRLIGDWIHSFNNTFTMRTTLDHRRQVNQRGNTELYPDLVATDTTVIHVTNPTIDLDFREGRFDGEAGLSAYKIEFDNTYRGDGRLIDNNDRNRLDLGGYLQPGVVILPNTVAYLRGEYMTRRYDTASMARTRDANISVGAAGIKYDLPHRLLLEAWGGVMNYKFKSGPLDDKTLPYFGGEARWWATDALETRLTLDRFVNPTISGSTTVIITDRVRLSAEYAPTDRLALNVAASYSDREYRSSNAAIGGGDRSEDYIVGEVGAEYALADHLNLGITYEHRNRASNVANTDFTRNIVSVFVRAPF